SRRAPPAAQPSRKPAPSAQAPNMRGMQRPARQQARLSEVCGLNSGTVFRVLPKSVFLQAGDSFVSEELTIKILLSACGFCKGSWSIQGSVSVYPKDQRFLSIKKTTLS